MTSLLGDQLLSELSTAPTNDPRRRAIIIVAAITVGVLAVALPLTAFGVGHLVTYAEPGLEREFTTSAGGAAKSATALNTSLVGFTTKLASTLDKGLFEKLEAGRTDLAGAIEDGSAKDIAKAKTAVGSALAALGKDVADDAAAAVKASKPGAEADKVTKAIEKLRAAIADGKDVAAEIAKVVALLANLTSIPAVADPAPKPDAGGDSPAQSKPPVVAPPVVVKPSPPPVVIKPSPSPSPVDVKPTEAPVDQNRYVTTNSYYVEHSACGLWIFDGSHDPGPGGTSVQDSRTVPWTYGINGTYFKFYLCVPTS